MKNVSKNKSTKLTAVVHLRKSEYDVYIGRKGRGQDGYFGNPHPIGFCDLCNCTHDREESIAAYRVDFNHRITKDHEFKEKILALNGKTLGCFCKPLACHGDVIAEYVNAMQSQPPAYVPKTIGIVGSRRRNQAEDYDLTLLAFNEVYRHGDTIVSGGCPEGGDKFAEVIAMAYDIPIKIHYPDWSRGRHAGLFRNTFIAEDADVLLAVVADNRKGGTEDTIRKYGRLGKTNLVLVKEA